MGRRVPFVQADEPRGWMAVAHVQDPDAKHRVPGRHDRDSVRPCRIRHGEPGCVRGCGVRYGLIRPYVCAITEVEKDSDFYGRVRADGVPGKTDHEEEHPEGDREPSRNQLHLKLLLKYV